MSYLDDQKSAHEDLAAAGRLVTAKLVTPGSYDPATGKTGAATEQTWELPAVFKEIKQRDVDGTNVKRGDELMLLSAYQGPAEINTDYTILDGLKTWQVVNVGRLQPGDTVILWKLQVRR